MVGGGPKQAQLEALVARHDLACTVKILGQRRQSEVGMLMRDAEALAFEATGSRVLLGTKAELVTAFRRELEAHAAQPDPIRDLSKAAHERALRYYAWEAKARKTVQAYDRVLGRRSAPPRFEN